MKKTFKLGNIVFPLLVFLTTIFFTACSSGNSGGGGVGGGGDNGGGGKPASVVISANPAWYNGTLVFSYTASNTISLQKEDGTPLNTNSGTVTVNNVTQDYVLKLTAVGSNNTTSYPTYTGKVYDDATTRFCIPVNVSNDSLYTKVQTTMNGSVAFNVPDTLRFRTDNDLVHYVGHTGYGVWNLLPGGNSIQLFSVTFPIFGFTGQNSFYYSYTDPQGNNWRMDYTKNAKK